MSEKLRVLLAGDFCEDPAEFDGGIQAVTWQLSESLVQTERVDLNVAAVHTSQGERPIQESSKTFNHTRAVYRDVPQGPRTLVSHLVDVPPFVRREAHRTNSQIVHGHGTKGLALGSVRSGLPHVVTVHGLMVAEEGIRVGGSLRSRTANRIFLRMEKYVFTQARHLISISPYVRAHLEKRARGEIHDIPNPIDSSFFAVVRKPQPNHILALSIMEPRKRIELLIEAAARAVKQVPDLRLHILGGARAQYRDYFEGLQKLVDELGVGETVTLHGRVEQSVVMDQYANCSFLAHAAAEESSPMAIAQAMAAGVPVVAADIPGVRHMVIPGQTGELTQSDPESIAQTWVTLLAQPGDLESMGKNANRAATDGFSAESIARKTVDLYERILSQSKR